MSLDRALLSLEGLSVGDAFGECFFSQQLPPAGEQLLPSGRWRWTDDTHMALSIVEVLQEYGRIDPDALAQAFARRFHQDPSRGYAGGAIALLDRLAHGEAWQEVAPSLFNGGSYGNGGAMRAAPIGAFFRGDPAQAAEEARLSAIVTHAHPEGQAGAIAVAAAAAIAASSSPPQGQHFLQETLAFISESQTRQGIQVALAIPADDLERAASQLGTGYRVSAQDTVPFCLWAAAYHLDDYEAALWWTVRGLGDRDTTCAIVGGIVALSAGSVPAEWLARREPLPQGFTQPGS
ncbi:MAG: ADP-ribosylglycohydrolase family protein [Chloroflexi bacterium]|nr:ADP-ribosylglycohydrolase family protein [Chloroflexota bacterium]